MKAALAALLLLALAAPAAKAGGACGVVTEPGDWTRGDLHGDLSVASQAQCRAAGLDRITRYATEGEALAALREGAIDAASGVTPDRDRARRFGVTFAAPFLFDPIRLMVRGDSAVSALADLAGRTVCFIAGEAGEASTLQEAEAAHVRIIPSPFEEEGEMGAALAGGRCAAVADTQSRLAMLAAQCPGVRLAFLRGTLGAIPASLATRAPSKARGGPEPEAQRTRHRHATVSRAGDAGQSPGLTGGQE